MTQFDDEATKASSVLAGPGGEAELARRAGTGDEQAFDLLYECYFARISWYFASFARREAEAAVQEVLTELFGSLTAPSDLPLAERAYRLARATELRHAAVPAKVEIAKNRAATTRALQVDS
jgi:hypothetical protein